MTLAQVVVDSSVAIKWLLPQSDSPQALKILEQHQNSQLKLLAPDLIYAEVGNIIWKISRFGSLSHAEGLQALELFQEINLAITPSEILLEAAYQFAVAHQRTVYDSLYVVLSQAHQCPLVTADEKLVNALSTASIPLIALQNWH